MSLPKMPALQYQELLLTKHKTLKYKFVPGRTAYDYFYKNFLRRGYTPVEFKNFFIDEDRSFRALVWCDTNVKNNYAVSELLDGTATFWFNSPEQALIFKLSCL